MLFTLKKIVSQLLNPIPLCLAILSLGLVCLWATRKQRLGKLLITLGTIFLLVVSLSFFSEKILIPLESRYPPLWHPETISWEGVGADSSPRWIVVLGAGAVSDPRVPITSQISRAGLGRVIEGLRLYKAIPGSKLLFSGGRVYDPVPEAEVMARIAVLLGANPEDISQEQDSRDTADEAAIIAQMVGGKKFILVTSAAHMPRSMALFKKLGLQPIPAPADYLVTELQAPNPHRFFPGVHPLGQTQAAWHEYLGLAWAWLRGLI
ncbi:MAG: envelope biogenesis factor ElyC [Thermodesulfobacteriota bacterium]